MTARAAAGALSGLLAAGASVGVGELAAAFVRPEASPIVAVGNRVVALTPEPVRQWAIREFGTEDKTVLLSGIYVAIAVLALAVGALAAYRLRLGLAGFALLGAFGVYAALSTHAASGSDGVPAAIGTAVGLAVLQALVRRIPAAAAGRPPDSGTAAVERRQFLVAGATTAGLAAIAGFGGRSLQHRRYTAAPARAAVALPRPASPARPLPNGTDLSKSGVLFVTPNVDFYRVDTALVVPQLDPAHWRLRIHGLVDRELTLSYDQLLARPLIERWITLCCVSNEVGGTLVSTARFLGARLDDLLHEAGISPRATQLLATSTEGMTVGTPTAVALDGRDAMLAVGMNGAPLPLEHGFPVRMVVPGLYGYTSACKWLVDLKATTYDDVAFWARQGWDPQQRIVLSSRIDRPSVSRSVTAGDTVPVAGVAWDQHVGVSAVQVRIDSGPWQEARLGAVPSVDTWRQWVLPWTVPSAGTHTLTVRAVDARGRPQDEHRAQPYPGAATGLHRITVHAKQM